MILLSWNYRELGNPATVLALCELVKARRPDVIFLFETLCGASRIEEICVRLQFFSYFNIDCVGRSGGISVFGKLLVIMVSLIDNNVLSLGICFGPLLLLILYCGFASVISMIF